MLAVLLIFSPSLSLAGAAVVLALSGIACLLSGHEKISALLSLISIVVGGASLLIAL